MANSKDPGIEIHLSCSICKAILKEPRITRCGHSFCRICLENLLESISKLNSRRFPLSASDTALNLHLDDTRQQSACSPLHFEFTCPYPYCGRKYRLRTADIDEFPPNCMLADVLKRYTAKENEKRSQCRIHQKKCRLFCVSCKLEICTGCLIKHNNSPHKAMEKVQAIQKFVSQSKQHIREACEDLTLMKRKMEDAIFVHEIKVNLNGEFAKLDSVFKTFEETTPLLEELKVFHPRTISSTVKAIWRCEICSKK